MNTLHVQLTLLVVALLMSATQAMTVCHQLDNGISRNITCVAGACVTVSYEYQLCSCFSGYTGEGCNILISSAVCPASVWGTLSNLQTKHVPTLFLPSAGGLTGVRRGNLTLDILSPLVNHRLDSKVQLGGEGTAPQCTYPSRMSTKTVLVPQCNDRFTIQTPWEDTLECAWQEEVTDAERTLTNDVMVEHRDLVDHFHGTPIYRRTVHRQGIVVRFPRRVVVSSLLNVFSSFSLMAALTRQIVEPDSHDGLLELTTSMPWPFVLKGASLKVLKNGVVTTLAETTTLADCPGHVPASLV